MKARKTDIPSIIPQRTPSQCFFCTKQTGLEKHHVIPGSGRKRCVEYGLWVWLCSQHHRLLHDQNIGYRELQLAGQKAFIVSFKKRGIPEEAARDEWLRLFGKFYD